MISAIIVFIIVLGLLVFIHELGHFVVARLFGVGIEEFGFGYPPKIFGIKKGETIYSINWIPIGGFVRIKGVVGAEEGEQTKEYKEDKNSFINKPIYQRFAILFAGVFMNFVLGAFLFAVGFMIGMPTTLDNVPDSAKIKNQELVIVESLVDRPAGNAGIEPGDNIIQVENTEVKSIDEFKAVTSEKQAGEEINLTVQRDEETLEKTLAVQEIPENENIPGIGVSLTETGIVSYSWYESVYRGFAYAIKLIGMIFEAIWLIFYGLFTSGSPGVDFSGPVGIAVLTNQVTQLGFIYILQFTALLSINLAIFNLLPIPALDGGRLIFLVIEKLRGKPVNQKIEATIHTIGFALLMLLVLIVTFRDVRKYEIFDTIKNFFV